MGVRSPNSEVVEVKECLAELSALAETAGAVVVGQVVQERKEIDPSFFIGRGKATSLAQLAQRNGAHLIIFDDDLSPAQVKNLERMTNVAIIDRSGLILDIFARRAKTREAKVQVELAQLRYTLPRLTRRWTHLSRQEGGIGTRGPGETQLEVDRRHIRKKISTLTKALDRIEQQRRTQRKARAELFQVALVGYTNSGKSTMLNGLSHAGVDVEDKLFATLDATTRVLEFKKNQRILLTDTVGFIRKLPHQLVASFRSTLEEITESDLLLHIVDVNHPRFEQQIVTVKTVLEELDALYIPTITVFNKADKLPTRAVMRGIRREYPGSIFTSALHGSGLSTLKGKVIGMMKMRSVQILLRVPQTEAPLLSFVYDLGHVIDRRCDDGFITVKASIDQRWLVKIQRTLRPFVVDTKWPQTQSPM